MINNMKERKYDLCLFNLALVANPCSLPLNSYFRIRKLGAESNITKMINVGNGRPVAIPSIYKYNII